MEYDGAMYRYVHNLQGDIVGILDAAGNPVVEYKYDAWGNAYGGAAYTNIGVLNPFRYRGYVYDNEIGMYYLRSRFYKPEWCRFINSDELLFGRGQTHNLFEYCRNNPVLRIDKTGKSSIAIGFGAWLLSGGWSTIVAAVRTAAPYILNGVFAGAAAYGINEAKSSLESKTNERTDVEPKPGPAPTVQPSATVSPNVTPNPNSIPKIPEYPGDDPEVAPEGYEWRGRSPQGSSQGNYHNPNTGESLHPDLDHEPPIGPHWDYWGPDGIKIRIFPSN